MIRIKFPSPAELSNEDWFEQMELTLYHAKKAYEKFIRDIEEEKKEDVSLFFSYPEMDKNKKFGELQDKEEIDFVDTQQIELDISF